jgi:hypothetical protein
MNSFPRQYQWFIGLAAGVTGITVFMGVTTWFINFILLFLFLGILVITRTWHDRGFYQVCGGETLVISCSIMNLWAGLFAVCMVAGIVCEALGLLESHQDLRPFALFCGVSFILTLLIQLSNHVLLPLIILGGMTALILVIQSVRSYQFRKHLTGA